VLVRLWMHRHRWLPIFEALPFFVYALNFPNIALWLLILRLLALASSAKLIWIYYARSWRNPISVLLISVRDDWVAPNFFDMNCMNFVWILYVWYQWINLWQIQFLELFNCSRKLSKVSASRIKLGSFRLLLEHPGYLLKAHTTFLILKPW
jgi:hypothetical protein